MTDPRPVSVVIGPTPDPRLIPVESPILVAWLSHQLPEKWKR